MIKKYSYSEAYGAYQTLISERSEWETEWRSISDYLLPGRGIYTYLTKPQKRKLTSPRVINTVAEDSLYILTSGMHGGLTSPSRPWFKLAWTDPLLQDFEPLKAWLQDCEDRLHAGLQRSNFYSIINSFYVEYAGFGTASMYVGHDTDDDDVPFRFELLTAGEYCFSVGPNNKVDQFFRTLFYSPRQAVEKFGNQMPKSIRNQVKNNTAGVDAVSLTFMEVLQYDPGANMPYVRQFYLVQSAGGGTQSVTKAVQTDGFYECPYPVARWNTIGSDTYGIGPGSRALPDIKRLQEMEKAFLMATHKGINPPLNAPARMRGKLNTLPGGYNYYANPNETVNEIYQVRFDYQGVGTAVERVEQRIQRNFFNDVFLTGSRDPNASPLRTGQVDAQEQEKMLRLGPVIERLQFEFLQPTIERTFNIMHRKDMFLPLPDELAQMAGDYSISLVSPLATAQRMGALNGINSFMAFLGNAAQFDPTILDNIDADAAAREFADITGVSLGVLRPSDDVQKIREDRAAQQAQQQAQEQAMAQAGMDSQMTTDQANAQKAQAEAGKTQTESIQIAQEAGLA